MQSSFRLSQLDSIIKYLFSIGQIIFYLIWYLYRLSNIDFDKSLDSRLESHQEGPKNRRRSHGTSKVGWVISVAGGYKRTLEKKESYKLYMMMENTCWSSESWQGWKYGDPSRNYFFLIHVDVCNGV